MITTREFFEHDAEDIINNIESIYSVQREESNKYLFEPFPSKDELLDKYEAGLSIRGFIWYRQFIWRGTIYNNYGAESTHLKRI